MTSLQFRTDHDNFYIIITIIIIIIIIIIIMYPLGTWFVSGILVWPPCINVMMMMMMMMIVVVVVVVVIYLVFQRSTRENIELVNRLK